MAALAEPTILLAGFALSIPAGSASLGEIVGTRSRPGQVRRRPACWPFVALAIVVVAEAGRLPVDNPSTHLELTMIHEAMVLEYAGRDLALVEFAPAMRLTVLLGLGRTCSCRGGWPVATPAAAGVAVGVVVFVVKVAFLGVALAAAEVFMAKLRLFRVPELLAGSFLFGVLAVSASSSSPCRREGTT